MSTWEDELMEEGVQTVLWKESKEDNIIVNGNTALDKWEIGKTAFDNAKQRIVKLPIAGKGHTVAVEISHRQPAPHTVHGVGVIFKTKKP